MDYLRPYDLATPVQGFAVVKQDPEPEYGYDDQDMPSSQGTVGGSLKEQHCYHYSVVCSASLARRLNSSWVHLELS